MSNQFIVYVVDDDPAVLESMTWLIESVHYEVKPFINSDDFLRVYDPQRPSCLILDVRMPGVSGMELQEILHKKQIKLPIIFITAHGDVTVAVRAMKQGAFNFLTKPVNHQELLETMNKALKRDAARLSQFQHKADVMQRRGTLTPREFEVMSHMVNGKLTRDIAEYLGISSNTVDIHRAKVMRKMCVKSLAELISLAFSANLIPCHRLVNEIDEESFCC